MALKTNNPKVSVVIPAYNAQGVIADAIKSIIFQTFADIEIIIIDDASTDNTAEIVAEYARRDDRIKAHFNRVNLGIGANRSKGIDLAVGEYICWQDADDVSILDRIERQVSYLDEHPKVGVVGGFLQFFDTHGDGVTRTYKEKDVDLRRTIFRYNPVAQPASMARRGCYDSVGGYDEALKVSEDLEMLLRIGTKYEFANIQQVVLRYRQSTTSLTRANLKRMELVTINLRRRYIGHFAYSFSVMDGIFNCAQYVSLWIMPVSFRMWLFAAVRGDR